MGTLRGSRGEVNGHTFNSFLACHVYDGAYIAMFKMIVPSFNVWCIRCIKGCGMLRNVSDRGRGKGHTVKIMGREQCAPNNHCAAVIGHLAGCATKVGDIVSAAIKR
jgi:hypothetical protein